MTTIKDYQEIAQQAIEDDKLKIELYRQIDDIDACNFEMPPALRNLSWIKNRKFVSIAPKNALQGSIRTFASRTPKIEIAPVREGEDEWSRVDRLERAVEFAFDQLSRRGEQSAFWKIVESAIKYCSVAFQVEYLPHTLKGKKGAKYDDLRRKGPFNFVVQYPGYVHPTYGKHGLESVLLAYPRTLQSVVDEFGMSNPGVVKLVAKVRAEQGKVSLRKMYVQFYDTTDYEERAIWMTFRGEQKTFNNNIEDAYVLTKEKHGLGFINWVFVDNKEPIMKPLVDGEVWKNANILNTVQQAMFLALAAHPRYWTNTPAGEGVVIDYDNPAAPMDLRPGETAGSLPAPEIDPGMAAAVAQMEKQMYESTAPRILSSAESLAEKGASFSTINAISQLSLSQLALAKSTAERALEEGIYLLFRWISFSEIPWITFLARLEMGENPSVSVVPGSLPKNAAPNEIGFELDALYITVTLQAQTLIDEQGRINNAILKYSRLGISQATAMEDVGIRHPAHEAAARLKEDLARQSLLPTADPNIERKDNNGAVFDVTKGMDTRAGTLATQTFAPATTREKITGRTVAGDEVL